MKRPLLLILLALWATAFALLWVLGSLGPEARVAAGLRGITILSRCNAITCVIDELTTPPNLILLRKLYQNFTFSLPKSTVQW